jgi:hypothetical protein
MKKFITRPISCPCSHEIFKYRCDANYCTTSKEVCDSFNLDNEANSKSQIIEMGIKFCENNSTIIKLKFNNFKLRY